MSKKRDDEVQEIADATAAKVAASSPVEEDVEVTIVESPTDVTIAEDTRTADVEVGHACGEVQTLDTGEEVIVGSPDVTAGVQQGVVTDRQYCVLPAGHAGAHKFR